MIAADPQVNDFVDAFESAQQKGNVTDLADFLPQPDHPLFRVVLRELIRVDLEFGWEQGRPRSLADYGRQFPQLFDDPDALREVAFEEYRLRVVGGANPSPGEYQQRYGIDIQQWPGFANYQQAGPANRLEPWSTTFIGNPAQVQWLKDLERTNPKEARNVVEGFVAMPEVGDLFLNFHLIAELGRGAFGRVFLARQGDLAHRLVALKVSMDLFEEEQKLAQLQHTHVVPIYSVHQLESLQAVCMPYFGATTLTDFLQALRTTATFVKGGKLLVDTLQQRRAEIIRQAQDQLGAETDFSAVNPGQLRSAVALDMLDRMSHVDAVLWLGERLADGLAHAHERGILHRDLKPANVLVTDEGQPMLLDFNLSADMKKRVTVAMGGTLPYMAPEQLETPPGVPQPADPRCDLYSLGVILYELATGRLPYEIPPGPIVEALPRIIEQRRQPPPAMRPLNPAITPALQSLIFHCLQRDPSQRYQSARDLRADLRRQRESRPLGHAPEPSLAERVQKWLRRHPQVKSPVSLAALGLGIVAMVMVLLIWNQHHLQAQATATLHRFQADLPEARRVADHLNLIHFFADGAPVVQQHLAKDLEACHRALECYGALHDPLWQTGSAVTYLHADQQQQLGNDVGEILYLLARWEHEQAGRTEEARGLNQQAESSFPKAKVPPAVLLQRSRLLRLHGDLQAAQQLDIQAGKIAPGSARELFLTACEQAQRGNLDEVKRLLEEAERQAPELVQSWFLKALALHATGHYHKARECYTTYIALTPVSPGAYYQRGQVHVQLEAYDEAEKDFAQVLHAQPLPAVQIQQASAMAKGDRRKLYDAIRLLGVVLERHPHLAQAYFLRAEVAQQTNSDEQRKLARQDYEKLLALKPVRAEDWTYRGRARALAEGGNDPAGALADFDEALASDPAYLDALFFKARVLADRLDRRADAMLSLDRLVEAYEALQLPRFHETRQYLLARLYRGLLHAQQGERGPGQEDAEFCYNLQPSPEVAYRAAHVYAATYRHAPNEALKTLDAKRAVKLLSYALRSGYLYHQYKADEALAPLGDNEEYRKMVQALDVLGSGPAPRMLPRLPD